METNSKIYLIMENAENGELYELIVKSEKYIIHHLEADLKKVRPATIFFRFSMR